MCLHIKKGPAFTATDHSEVNHRPIRAQVLSGRCPSRQEWPEGRLVTLNGE